MTDPQPMTDAPAPETETPTPPADNNEPESTGGNNSFFIPGDMIGDKTYKEGDSITLQVMGTDEDGDLEVCLPGEGGGWKNELQTKLSEAGKGAM